MRSEITKLAHALRKAGKSWAEAMKRAWYAIRLKMQMATKAVSFFYVKENGEERYAIGNNAIAPSRIAKPAPPKSLLCITYFDVLVDDWRSFRVDRLLLLD